MLDELHVAKLHSGAGARDARLGGGPLSALLVPRGRRKRQVASGRRSGAAHVRARALADVFPDAPQRLKGNPVLFLPGWWRCLRGFFWRARCAHHASFAGQAGSYKQVRSLGAAAHRLESKLAAKETIDVFTVDFNEEFSALSGEQKRRRARSNDSAATNDRLSQAKF